MEQILINLLRTLQQSALSREGDFLIAEREDGNEEAQGGAGFTAKNFFILYCKIFDSRNSNPVSYTHLDVYKRQVLDCNLQLLKSCSIQPCVYQ